MNIQFFQTSVVINIPLTDVVICCFNATIVSSDLLYSQYF